MRHVKMAFIKWLQIDKTPAKIEKTEVRERKKDKNSSKFENLATDFA